MSFAQAYYTSCSRGLAGTQGFQINAASAEIPPEVLKHLERIGTYSPPPTAPSRPSPEELRLFPVALFFHRLQTGGGVIGQSRYIGRDYSGRFGNYFAHHLYTDDLPGAFAVRLPIEFWNSPAWSTTESATPSLPELPELPPGDMTRETAWQFANREDRGRWLTPFLAAVEEGLRTRRRLILVADSTEVAHWIAVASFALPRSLALDMTFTTYVRHPYDTEALVSGTTVDTDFTFAPYEVEQQFSVFDFHGARSSAPRSTAFAEYMSGLYRSASMSAVCEATAFISAVDPKLPADDLATAILCYRAIADHGPRGAGLFDAMAWVTRTIAGWPADPLRKLLESMLTAASYIESEASRVIALLHAAAAPGVPVGNRMAVESFACKWSMSRPAVVAADLVQRLAEHSFLAELPDALQPWPKDWATALEKVREPARLIAQLDFAASIHLLRSDPEITRRAAATCLAPQAGDSSVQLWLERSSTAPFCESLLFGLTDYLRKSPTSESVLAAIARMLKNAPPQLRASLHQFAKSENDISLYCRLQGIAASQDPQNRATFWANCLAAIREAESPESTELLATAFRGCMTIPKPTTGELDAALSAMTDDEIISAEAPSMVARLLFAIFLSATFDEKWRTLAAKLRSLGGERLPKEDHAVYSAVISAAACNAPGGRQTDLLEFTAAAMHLPTDWIERLVLDACPFFFAARAVEPEPSLDATPTAGTGDANSRFHRCLLHRGHEEYPRRFLNAWATAVTRYLSMIPNRNRSDALIRLITDWTALEPALDLITRKYFNETRWIPEGAAPRDIFWKQLFPAGFYSLQGAERDRFLRAIRGRRDVWLRYRAWRRVVFKQRAVRIAKESSLILIATLIVLAAIWAGPRVFHKYLDSLTPGRPPFPKAPRGPVVQQPKKQSPQRDKPASAR